jgi:hypothetical protein
MLLNYKSPLWDSYITPFLGRQLVYVTHKQQTTNLVKA